MADQDNILLDVMAADDQLEHVLRNIDTQRTDDRAYSPMQTPRTDDVIVEEDVIETGARPTLQRKNPKKGVIVARRSSDVLVKRPASTPAVMSSPEIEVKVTRRSVSRQGSRVQQASRTLVVDEQGDSTQSVLKSVTQNEFNRRKVNELARLAQNRLKHHQSLKSQVHPLKSRTFHAALKITKANGIAIITGRSGSGKTHTAMDLMLELTHGLPDHKPIITSCPFDIDFLENTPVQSVVFVDDCFGKSAIDMACVNYFTHNIEKLKTMLRRKQIVLTLTACNDVLETLRKNAGAKVIALLDIDGHKVDLDGDKFKLTEQERIDQISEYFEESVISEYHTKKLLSSVESDFSLGFPLTCFLSKVIHIDSLLEDPNEALINKLEMIKSGNISQLLLLWLVMLLDGKFPASGLNSVDKKYFIQLTELFPDKKCSYADVQSAIPVMKACHFVAEDMHSCLFIPHEIVFQALVKTFIPCVGSKTFGILPICVMNKIHFQPEDSEDEQIDGESICTKVISSTEYQNIAKLFFNILGTKCPTSFRLVAKSGLWEQNGFFDSVLDTCGLHFFFVTDVNGTPLSVFFVHGSKDCVVSKLGRCFSKTLAHVLSQLRPLVAMTATEMITFKMEKGLSRFLNVCSTQDMPVVKAVIKSREKHLIEAVMNPMLGLQPSIGFLVQTACSFGHLETLNLLFSKADKQMIQSFKVRKNKEGLMLVHFAAIGDDVRVLTFLDDHGFDLKAQSSDGSTILDVASMYGNTELVKSLYDRFPDLLSMTNNFGFTCAHLAVREGHSGVFQDLVELGVDPTFKVHGGNTIFHLAAANGNTAVLRKIMTMYVDIKNIPNDNTFSPQQMAAMHGQLDALMFFFKHGVDLNERTVDGRSFLHLVAFHGHFDVVEYLCNNHPAVVSMVDQDGNTAAHDAAASGKLEVLIFLIQNFIDPRSLTHDGGTLMHEACYYGRLSIAQYLCNNFNDFENRETSNGYSPCHAAALGGLVDILELLISSGADPLTLTCDGSTILHEAAFAGNEAMARYILSLKPEMISVPNNRSYLPSHFAAQEGRTDLLESLIIAMNGELATTQEKQTYLHIASYNGRMEVVKRLCQNFPELIQQQDVNGSVALHYAARGGHSDVFDYFVSKNVNPMCTTSGGSTVLHLAALDGHMEIIQHLCHKYPALVELMDDLGQTPLHYAAGCGKLDVLSYFIERKLDPNARTSNGSTMLLKAVYNGSMDVVKHICAKYPDMLPLTDNFGCNALHYAASGGHKECLEYLLGDKTMDPFATTEGSQTILHVAAYHGKMHVVELLCNRFPSMKICTDSSGRTPGDFAKLGENVDIALYLGSDNKSKKRLNVSVHREPQSVVGELNESAELTAWQKFLALFCLCRSV